MGEQCGKKFPPLHWRNNCRGILAFSKEVRAQRIATSAETRRLLGSQLEQVPARNPLFFEVVIERHFADLGCADFVTGGCRCRLCYAGSCHCFRSNEVRLGLRVLAYDLGNPWGRLALRRGSRTGR